MKMFDYSYAEIYSDLESSTILCIEYQTHSDDDVHRADVGFPVGVNGHRSDLHQLPGPIVPFVHLNEGGEAFGVEVQLCWVGENLDAAFMTFDLQGVRVAVAGLALVDLEGCNI